MGMHERFDEMLEEMRDGGNDNYEDMDVEPFPQFNPHTIVTDHEVNEHDAKLTMTYLDDEREVTMSATKDINFLPNMIEMFVRFAGHVAFEERVVHKFMRLYLDENEE